MAYPYPGVQTQPEEKKKDRQTAYDDWMAKKNAPPYIPPTAQEQEYKEQLQGLVGPGEAYNKTLDDYIAELGGPDALKALNLTPEMVSKFAGNQMRYPKQWQEKETARRMGTYNRNLALVGNKALSGIMGGGGGASSGGQFAGERFADIAGRGAVDIKAQVGEEAYNRQQQGIQTGMEALSKYATQYDTEKQNKLAGLQQEAVMHLQAGQMTQDDIFNLLKIDINERDKMNAQQLELYNIVMGGVKKNASPTEIFAMLAAAGFHAFG